MEFTITKVPFIEIQFLRHQFLSEHIFQIRYHACHERGWSDSYLISGSGQPIGYGSVKGKEELSRRDAIFEFYIVPDHRNRSSIIYEKLIEVSKVKYLECQTNDLMHSNMVYEFSKKITSDTILFKDQRKTELIVPDAIVRPRLLDDLVFEKNKGAGAHVLIRYNEVVASGGFLLHYNEPFVDLYMETRHEQRGKGYASFLVQEIKKLAYGTGRVPAARCNIKNLASKATLQKAGLEVAGFMLMGNI